MLCDLVEAGKVCTCAIVAAVVVCRCDHNCVSSSAGGMLPVLAQRWLSDVWRVHSGAARGGKTNWLCGEDFQCH